MTIKDIIDNERWGGTRHAFFICEKHNASPGRIEAAVTAYVAELEEALDVSYNAEREADKVVMINWW